VIEVLGDVGKRHPSFIPLILQSIDVDSSNSLMVSLFDMILESMLSSFQYALNIL